MKQRATLREKLEQMRPDEPKDLVLSIGMLRITQNYSKTEEGDFIIDDFSDGWTSTLLTIDQMEAYLLGQIDPCTLEWE